MPRLPLSSNYVQHHTWDTKRKEKNSHSRSRVARQFSLSVCARVCVCILVFPVLTLCPRRSWPVTALTTTQLFAQNFARRQGDGAGDSSPPSRATPKVLFGPGTKDSAKEKNNGEATGGAGAGAGSDGAEKRAGASGKGKAEGSGEGGGKGEAADEVRELPAVVGRRMQAAVRARRGDGWMGLGRAGRLEENLGDRVVC